MIRSLIVLVAVAGCAGQKTPPAPSDPTAGKAALQKVLDAWKNGDTLDAFQKANPDITVVNTAWQQGVKLPEYTIDEKSDMNGYDVQFTVRESAKKGGKVSYTVSTTPKLVVIRNDPGS